MAVHHAVGRLHHCRPWAEQEEKCADEGKLFLRCLGDSKMFLGPAGVINRGCSCPCLPSYEVAQRKEGRKVEVYEAAME